MQALHYSGASNSPLWLSQASDLHQLFHLLFYVLLSTSSSTGFDHSSRHQNIRLQYQGLGDIMATGRPHGPEFIHLHTGTIEKFDAMVRHMRDTAWEHEQISRLVKSVNAKHLHEEALARYQSLEQQQKLKYLYQAPHYVSSQHPTENAKHQPEYG